MTTKPWSEQLKEAGAQVGDLILFNNQLGDEDFTSVNEHDLCGLLDNCRQGCELEELWRQTVKQERIWQRKEGGE